MDLYSGVGGFSMGAHWAGMSVVSAYDIDPILSSSFSTNFPNTKLHLADLSEVSGSDISKNAGDKIDGVFGGPPCQGFSNIGHRKTDDPRRLLLTHFFRLVSEIRPKFFVMENVMGLTQGEAQAVLSAALEHVSSRYKLIGPVVLDASDYGAATKRKRLFVIGFDPSESDLVSLKDIEQFKSQPATVEDAISDLHSATFLNEDLSGFDNWLLSASGCTSEYAAFLRSADLTFTSHKLTNHSQAVIDRFKGVRQGEMDSVGRHPRLSWSGYCPTLRAGTGVENGSYQSVRPIHPVEPRVITVREAARLQGFPDSHRFHPAIWHSFRMIGNSVSPFVAKAIFRAIAKRCGEDNEQTGQSPVCAAE